MQLVVALAPPLFPQSRLPRRPDAHFIQVREQVSGIVVHSVRAGALELLSTIPTRQDPDAQSGSAARGEEVPDAVADDDGSLDGDAQTLGGGEKEVGVWFRVRDLIACHDRGVRRQME